MGQEIRRVIADVMGLDESELPSTVSFETVGEWDSLHHFQLMLALETEFGITVDAADMTRLVSADAIQQYLERVTTHA